MEQRHPDEQYPCIYTITNTLTGEQYVGCTVDKYYRWKAHLSTLHCGTHGNLSLQAAWDRDGEAAFVFAVVERLAGHITYRDLHIREQVWLDQLQPAYNVTGCLNTYTDAARSVRSLRVHRGWTQAELARRAATTHGVISGVETGRHHAYADLAARIANALNTPVEAIDWGQRHPDKRREASAD